MRKSLSHLLGGVLILVLAHFFPHIGYATEPALQDILFELRLKEAARKEGIRAMVYTAEASLVEWEDDSRDTIKSRTTSVRKVYVRQQDQIRNQYLSMTIDGRSLDKKEMERELAKQRRSGRNRNNEGFQSPFSSEVEDLYRYELRGEGMLDGQKVWLVDFNPKEVKENLFTGTAYISVNHYQPVYVEMAPSKLPGVLKEFAMSVRFAPVGEYWLPSVFSMNMRVKVSFLVTLTERTLSIEDRYSDYELNAEIDPGIFESG